MPGRAHDAESQRLAAFARIGSDWLWETDAEGRFSYFSVDVTRGGIDLGNRIGMTRGDVAVADAENARRIADLDAIFARREPFCDFRYVSRNRAGEGRWCQISGEPVFRSNEFVGYRGVGRDVTELVVAQAGLEAKSRALDAILAAMPDGVRFIDADGQTLAINPQINEITETTPRLGPDGFGSVFDAMLDNARRGEYGPGDPVKVATERLASLKRLIAEGRNHTYQRQTTSGRWFEGRLRPIHDGSLLMLYRDITDDKRREAELERQSALLGTILKNLDDGISIFDSDNRLVLWNDRFPDIIGLDAALVVRGAKARDLMMAQARAGEYGPGDPEAALKQRMAEISRFPSAIYERVRPNGKVLEVRRYGMPDGGAISIYLDITERKRAEVALQELNATLEQRVAERTEEARRARDTLLDALESVNNNLIIYDRDDRLVLFTRHLYEQYPDADKFFIVGNSFAQIFREAVERGSLLVPPGEDKEKFIADRIALHQRADGKVTSRQLRGGGTLHISEHRSQSGGIVAIGRDVTEHLKVETQLREAQRMEAIGQLTGGLAHDLNNYLAVIMGNLDLLAEMPPSSGEALALVEGAIAGAERGAELTRSLLAFSRRQPLAPRVLDVGAHIRALAKLIDRTIGERIEVRLDIPGSLWRVAVDGAQLDSALINLANNARDAMPNGGNLRISVRNVPDSDGGRVMVEVTDDGIGMDGPTQGRAFEPFFSTKQASHGTGLGLSMVHGFVHQSGGTIEIESSPGRGTTVRLFLPRVQTSEDAAGHGAGTSRLNGGSERILVVEDNDHVRETVAGQLRSLGYRIVEAESGDAALRLLESDGKAFDLILSDMVMPGRVDGGELARQVGERWPNIAVLLTSGFAGDPGTWNAVRVPVLRKPYRKAELANAIRAVLAGEAEI